MFSQSISKSVWWRSSTTVGLNPTGPQEFFLIVPCPWHARLAFYRYFTELPIQHHFNPIMLTLFNTPLTCTYLLIDSFLVMECRLLTTVLQSCLSVLCHFLQLSSLYSSLVCPVSLSIIPLHLLNITIILSFSWTFSHIN